MEKINGKQKVSGKWQEIKCDSNCQYRVLDEKTNKPACAQEGVLKFMLPKVSSDRVWIMRIKSYYSIQALKNYIEFQKQIGNSLKGDFVLYLTEKTQTSKATGKSFKNQILNIVKKEDFNIEETTVISNINSIEEKKEEPPKKEVKKSKTSKKESTAEKATKTTKTTSKSKTTSSKAKKQVKSEKEDKSTKIQETSKAEDSKEYMLIDTSNQSIVKKGKKTKYLIGTFGDIDENVIDVIIPPSEAEKLSMHALGTIVKLDLNKTSSNKYYTNSIEYVSEFFKQEKVAA